MKRVIAIITGIVLALVILWTFGILNKIPIIGKTIPENPINKQPKVITYNLDKTFTYPRNTFKYWIPKDYKNITIELRQPKTLTGSKCLLTEIYISPTIASIDNVRSIQIICRRLSNNAEQVEIIIDGKLIAVANVTVDKVLPIFVTNKFSCRYKLFAESPESKPPKYRLYIVCDFDGERNCRKWMIANYIKVCDGETGISILNKGYSSIIGSAFGFVKKVEIYR